VAVVGIGVDIVDVARFGTVLARTPSLLERLFTPAEQHVTALESRAARFAAKEAVAKVLGAPPGLRWHDAEVVTGADRRPQLVVRGTVADAAGAVGIRHWHLSLSHDGGMAIAMVVGES
jgi:holo-[acyl-carrier protein] synthase